ncbi:MAG TPA: hypothetical protein VK892_18870 [Pyrinomonadaceae bacterium]|nr:hypothetical protein [Pyrinomonadaceae bacterium]
MSYGLEFLSVKLDSVKDFFASGNPAIVPAIIAEGKRIYDGEDEEAQENRFVWEEIVNSLSGGNLGKYLAGQKPLGTVNDENFRVSQMKSLAIAVIIRKYSDSIAGVFHSSGSGEIFRTEPFEYIKEARFLGGVDPFLLLERPFFNYLPHSFPSWGGLTRAELDSIPLDELTSARPDSGDTDVDIWVGGLLDLIEESKLRELDLITLYE